MVSGMSSVTDLIEQNRILRERLERLERGSGSPIDALVRVVTEHAPAFFSMVTPDGRIVATGRTSEAFGSVVGRSVDEFTEAGSLAVTREAFARVVATRQPTTYETVGFGENGEPNHTYVVRAAPLLEDGVVSLILLIPTDITERVRLERSLAISEQKLRLAVEGAGVGLWSWDFVRDEVKWDQRLMDIFGAGEVPRDYPTYLALIHPDDVALVRRNVEAALATGVYTPFEHRLAPRGDGVERWVLGLGSVQRDATGKALFMMGGAVDITSQKRTEAQLQRAQRVEALGQLSAGLAHNFNNLLGVMLPNLELLREQTDGEPAALADAALSAALQARDLIKRLMSITAPRAAGAAATSDPREVLDRAAGICRATFPREIALTTDIQPDLGHVSMSGSELEQVVLNLLVNARDALEDVSGRERRIEILVDTVLGGAGVKLARVRVRDSGVGMAAALSARVFEPFFTTKPAHRGAGLGLADALVRVREAGGNLECESEEGRGSTFTILLPLAAVAPTADVASSPPATSGRGETILIVDDEAMVRGAVGRLLKRRGYEVVEAGDAKEARALLATEGARVRLVLLDQSMPHETGPEALPSLKRLTAAPIVLFSGGNVELPPGAAAVLQKPAQAAELFALVQELLGKRQ
jgi:PAS domain S-box-containing protein